MAATSYGVNHAMAVKAWAKRLFVEALKQTRAEQFRGSTSSDSLVSRRTELNKQPGDKVTVGLRMQLTGVGTAGDGTLEGNEEPLSIYTDAVIIDQLRHAVRSGGKMSEQRVPFEVRAEAMAGLRDWWADRIDCSMFNQLCGATTQEMQANGQQSTSVDASFRYSGMQTAIAPTAGTGIIICDTQAGVTTETTEASLSATVTFSLKLGDIDRAVARAKTSTPAIRPLRVNGDNRYVLFLHPYQTYQLRQNTSTGQWQDINKQILAGGRIGDNPIITGMLGVYNNVMLVEDARVPSVASSVTASTSYRRGVFCGAQAAMMAVGGGGSDTTASWVEELFDYQNQLGVSGGMIFGMKKTVFNSSDFATIVMSSYAPSV